MGFTVQQCTLVHTVQEYLVSCEGSVSWCGERCTVYSVHCTVCIVQRWSRAASRHPVSRQRPAGEEGETGWWRTTVWDISSACRVEGECGDKESVVEGRVGGYLQSGGRQSVRGYQCWKRYLGVVARRGKISQLWRGEAVWISQSALSQGECEGVS